MGTQTLRNVISHGDLTGGLFCGHRRSFDRVGASKRSPPNTTVFINHIDR